MGGWKSVWKVFKAIWSEVLCGVWTGVGRIIWSGVWRGGLERGLEKGLYGYVEGVLQVERRLGRICRLETKPFKLRSFCVKGISEVFGRVWSGVWRMLGGVPACQHLAELEPAGRGREGFPFPCG